MSRGKPCDTCRRPRQGWQRLCDECYRVLPGSHRTAILDFWRRGDRSAHRRAVKAAKRFLEDRANAHLRACANPVTPERAAQLHARMLGERE